MANSVGLVLTLVTLSSNGLQLTTSLLDAYISGQVDQLLFCCAHGVSQVGVSLLLVIMGYLSLLLFLIMTEHVTR